jgi:predicted component of type VI protein secretion system
MLVRYVFPAWFHMAVVDNQSVADRAIIGFGLTGQSGPLPQHLFRA